MTAPPPLPDQWTKFLMDIYIQAQPPVLGTVNIKEIEEKAREVMKDHLPAYMYTFGSAGTCLTDVANKKALENWKLVPRMLVGATNRSLETTIMGVKYPAPIFLAPVGVQGILHADGELASARAAGNVGVPYIMSTASTRSIEDVAAANGPNSHRWYQLYWPRTSEIVLSLLKRVKASGFTALVITLDTMILGWRPHDLETAYLPFAYGVGIQVGTSDPVFMKRFGLEPRQGESPAFPFEPTKIREAAFEKGDEHMAREMLLGKEWLGEVNSGVFRTWEDVKFIRDNWDSPIVLKGIQRVSDAEKATAMGIEGIIVSNHGGRQVDGAIGSLDALDMIMRSRKVRAAQRSGKLTVLFDSGIRTGSDIIKALAIGAQGVLIGRPFMYGLAIAGQEGVEQILLQTICDLHITMGLTGYGDINEIIGKRDEILRKLEYKL
ncbi:FMN-dependent dehydrogenase [Boletus edulis BED1]|uniref:FMN-dependent dehydrogenase n=1 Tax=Boletus edulis BED1 TaxID=1328754 RepID=A0AAD4BK06_BOLED|nr:FMN-dependent dehydrogenase [Boletus edulis BED1]